MKPDTNASPALHARQLGLTVLALGLVHSALGWAFTTTLVPAHRVSVLDEAWRSDDTPLDVLIVGDSHARNAVEPRAFRNGLSLAVGGEHYTKTRARMASLHQENPRDVGTILIPLDHVSLSGWKAEQFAPEAVWGQHVNFWALGRERGQWWTFAPMALKAGAFPYIGEFESAMQRWAGTRAFQGQASTRREPPRSLRKTGVDAARAHLATHAEPNPFLLADLERLIDASLARGTKVVLVSYPMTGGYLRTAQALGVPHPATLPDVQRLLSRSNVRHLDHSADFVGMPHLFWDGDHLNAAGRKALTTALRQELIATR